MKCPWALGHCPDITPYILYRAFFSSDVYGICVTLFIYASHTLDIQGKMDGYRWTERVRHWEYLIPRPYLLEVLVEDKLLMDFTGTSTHHGPHSTRDTFESVNKKHMLI